MTSPADWLTDIAASHWPTYLTLALASLNQLVIGQQMSAPHWSIGVHFN